MASEKWQAVNRRILDAIDVRAEFESMGVAISNGAKPSASGWLACKVFGTDERNPSAGINVGSEHPQRGRYKEFTGEARNLSFFEFCAITGKYATWQDARKAFAKQFKITLLTGRHGKSPEETLGWKDWNENLVATWCQAKPPITIVSVRMAGGRLATWPLPSKKFLVIAVPIYGPAGLDDDLTGFVFWSKSGRPLPHWQGKGQPPKLKKILIAAGSKSGMVGRHALQHLDEAEVIWKCEGVPDMLAIQSMVPAEQKDTHLALTNSSGSMETPREEFTAMFVGKIVYIVHDCDSDGQKGGARWAEAISLVAAEVRHVTLPYPIEKNHGKDVRDYLNDGHTYQDLLDLAEAADPLPKPDPVAEGEVVDAEKGYVADQRIVEELGLTVLGETEDRQVVVFSENNNQGKTQTLNVARLSYADLLQVCGPIAKERVHQAAEPVAGEYHFKRVLEALALLGGRRRVGVGDTCGRGCWMGSKKEIVLVGAGKGAVWDGEKLRELRTPLACGLVLDFSASEPWFHHVRLAHYLQLSADKHWVDRVVDQAIQLFQLWYWRRGNTAPHLAVGLAMATWIQTIWHWRPLVSLAGESDSGKTNVFEMLAALYGHLGLLSTKPTEAGLRQTIKNRAICVLVDEFENDVHRRRILELLRTSGKGSRQVRGTSDQRGTEYGLKHIVWVSAVEVGLSRQPDKNRFINLELDKPPPSKWGHLDLPPSDEITDLGQKLLAISIRFARQARPLAHRLREEKFPHLGIEGRQVENMAVPVSLLALSAGMDEYTAAKGLMLNILEGLEHDPSQGVSDQVQLVHAILSSIVDLGRGDRATVAQILIRPNDYIEGAPALTRVGIGRLWKRRGPRPVGSGMVDYDAIFFVHDVIRRQLLKGTEWQDQQIDQLLVRLPTAKKTQRRCPGRVYGVLVGREYMEEEFLSGD